MSAQLRQPVHRGSVLASGLAFSLALLGEREVRRRVLALSARAPLESVVRVEGALVALWRRPQRVICERSEGAPLVRQGEILSMAPLASDELAALPAQQALIVLVERGAARCYALDELPREDLTSWLDVSRFQLRADLRSLGDEPAAPRPVLLEVQLEAREALGVAPLAAESEELLRSLRDGRAEGLAGLAGSAAGGAGAPSSLSAGSLSGPLSGSLSGAFGMPALLGGRASWWARLRHRFWSALAVRAGERGAGAFASSAGTSGSGLGAGSGGAGRALAPLPPRQSWLGRAAAALGELAARAVMRTQLRELLGRRYARYLQKIFELFDGNQLDDALRHAIPLGGAGGAGDALHRLPWSPPSPREDLSVTTDHRPGGSAIGFAPSLYDALKERYRRAFERLRDRGDIEKAAFVLAELLHADEEAVSFLEKHGKLRLAAELAEARQLPPGLVVRQWFLAREAGRAVRLARRHSAFADAVARLEQTHPEAARALRLMWADSLAEAGAYPAAVDVVWPVEQARPLALGWLDRAIAVGGASGARMLVRKAKVAPQRFAEVQQQVLALFEDGEASPHVHEALAVELLAGEPTAESRVLMRSAVRRLLRERGEVGGLKLVPRLLEACGDPALRIDAGPVVGIAIDEQQARARAEAEPALAKRTTPLQLAWSAADRGAVAISDACELPDGRLLVALGELGAWLLTRDGRVLARFSEPAHRLVPSLHGDRAILVAPRGESTRLARLDLIAKRCRPWCDVHLDRYAGEYDGATWFTSRGGSVHAIDALADGWSHAWKVHEQDAVVHALQRDAQSLHVWFHKVSGAVPRAGSAAPATTLIGELWRYELPTLALRQRTATPLDGISPAPCALAGGAIAMCLDPSSQERLSLSPAGRAAQPHVLAGGRWRAMPATAKPILAAAPQMDHELVAFVEVCASPPPAAASAASAAAVGAAVCLYDYEEAELRARICLHGRDEAPPLVGVRFSAAHLLVFDSLGRLLILSRKTGETVRRLRLA